MLAIVIGYSVFAILTLLKNRNKNIVMGLFDSLITINLGDSFTPDAGIEAIKQELQHSPEAQFYDLPKGFVGKLRSCLDDCEVQFFYPDAASKPKWLDYPTESLPNRVKADYYGQDMYVGEVNFPHQSFDVIWRSGKVYDIGRVRVDKCLRCSFRRKVRRKDTGQDVRIGSVINRDEWDEFIGSELKAAKGEAIISNLPLTIMKDFWPLILRRDFRLVLPPETHIPFNLKANNRVRILPGMVKLESIVYGLKVNCGVICLPHIILGIGWDEENVVSVRTFEQSECVNCLKQIYKMAWRFCLRP